MTRGLLLAVSAWALAIPARARAQAAPPAAAVTAEADIKATFRRYDAALRAGDPAAVAPFWADEYVFVNLAGARVTRAERLANLRASRTTFDSLAQQPKEEQVRVYGDLAIFTSVITIAGQYSGRRHRGEYRALAVVVKRDGRWQQVISQLTPIAGK
jgi:uncharacterized protein (TIGR02246 family)